jgi:hypothetical protein
MQKTIITTSVSVFFLLFGGCSNMEMGFDEDSVFYSKKTKTLKSQEVKKQESIKSTLSIEEEKNKTTFYYERDDGE